MRTGPPANADQGGTSLVVTDLDGTLWDRGGAVHPETAAAIRILEQRGVPLLAATARRPASAARVLSANRLSLPAVLFDGSLGRDLRSGATFHRSVFDSEAAAQVLEVLLAAGLEPIVNFDGSPVDALAGPAPATHADHLAFLAPNLRRGDLRQGIHEVPVLSYLICGAGEERLRPVLESLGGLASASVTADLVYGGHSLSVRPRGVSKLQGVLAFCAANGLDPDRILAIGDGDNDVELLAGAAVACAVADGCPALLDLAHHVVPGPEHGGWARIVDLLA